MNDRIDWLAGNSSTSAKFHTRFVDSSFYYLLSRSYEFLVAYLTCCLKISNRDSVVLFFQRNVDLQHLSRKIGQVFLVGYSPDPSWGKGQKLRGIDSIEPHHID